MNLQTCQSDVGGVDQSSCSRLFLDANHGSRCDYWHITQQLACCTPTICVAQSSSSRCVNGSFSKSRSLINAALASLLGCGSQNATANSGIVIPARSIGYLFNSRRAASSWPVLNTCIFLRKGGRFQTRITSVWPDAAAAARNRPDPQNPCEQGVCLFCTSVRAMLKTTGVLIEAKNLIRSRCGRRRSFCKRDLVKPSACWPFWLRLSLRFACV